MIICDQGQCPAYAKYQYTFATGQLYFCNHHADPVALSLMHTTIKFQELYLG